MSIMDLNEQELFRRESLAKLRELGIEPYPAPLFPINTSAAQIKAEFDIYLDTAGLILNFSE